MFRALHRLGKGKCITQVSSRPVIVVDSVVQFFHTETLKLPTFVSRFSYVRAAANTRLIGKQLAFLLKKLNKHNGLDFNRTHIIGFR